jgi:hypothetical protein
VGSNRRVSIGTGETNSARNHNSSQEIAAFLQALSSYPEHFEQNPRLSFEQHMVRIAGNASLMPENVAAR